MTAPTKENPRPPVGPLPRLLGLLLLPATALLVWGGLGILNAPAAYAYQNGQDVTVTTAPGSECTTVYRGGGGTTCDATWVVDGTTVRGTLTSQYGGAVGFLAGDTTARVNGDTAYAGFDAGDLAHALRAPYLVAAGLLLLVPGLLLPRAMARRIVDRRIDAGERVPWGPFVLQRDGLGIGGAVVPWAQVEEVRHGGRVITVRVAGQDLSIRENRITYQRPFKRVVRSRAAAARG